MSIPPIQANGVCLYFRTIPRHKLFTILLPVTRMKWRIHMNREVFSIWFGTDVICVWIRECVIFCVISLSCAISQASLPHPSMAQAYKCSIHFWAALHEIQHKLHIPGINLHEYCLHLANSPKSMLQNLTELLLISFLKGKCLAIFITLRVEKSITH